MLQAAKKGQITQRQAAAELKLSRRWVKKLIRRLRKQGDRGVLHGLKGRPSNRRIAAEVERKAVKLIREHYRDYGPTQAAEMLEQQHGIAVSRETVRGWMCKRRCGAPSARQCIRFTAGVHAGNGEANSFSGIRASTIGSKGEVRSCI